MTTIAKATIKGQITLPAQWRKNFDTNRYLIKQDGNKLIISPINMNDLEDEAGWTTIFSADHDNNGKAIPAEDFIKILKGMQ